MRNNEYYHLQDVFDELHEKASNEYYFRDLMRIITSEKNILLAYRTIKTNKGSTTPGTDGRDITYYKNWGQEKFIYYFQNKLSNYFPKSVRRVEIPKPNGKIRPLGIPCMDDRIIQQCIKQVLEPICEAKFHNHSYGFRPNRATSHAIARANYLMWKNQLHYVVDIDIKGFFDNVHHGKLLKQLWQIGIRDKNLLSIIRKILKSEIQGLGVPEKGTPQGGIISPLLSNVVLNELDWWLSNQWETFKPRHQYSNVENKSRALKTTNLKEFFFVRYADDFKLFCRDYQTAQKIFIATKQWLQERLGLEISPEKSKITNVRKGKTEFLGFKLYVKKKRNKYVTRSNISDKAKQTMKKTLKEQVKTIQRNPSEKEANRLNAMILGMHNYYRTATLCNMDFKEIYYSVNKSLECRLKSQLTVIPNKSKTYMKLYGSYNTPAKGIKGIALFPIFGCKYLSPPRFSQEINNYTKRGRLLIHDKLNGYRHLIYYLLKQKSYNKSVEYKDNSISLIAGQRGKCFVTNKPLVIGNMECHHKHPIHLGGTDEYSNLVWLQTNVHKLVHATQSKTINKYLNELNLDKNGMRKVNSLRLLAENLEITL
ncbi:group II intron reverse transcriptase/maturase [Oceanobacillus sp. SE10311]|uniref:group II intron reverse transcriptase/maturase n=1 Tax=Oceanobacillus sp. SE10311 TaxID=3098289 RepID=UPI00300E0420